MIVASPRGWIGDWIKALGAVRLLPLPPDPIEVSMMKVEYTVYDSGQVEFWFLVSRASDRSFKELWPAVNAIGSGRGSGPYILPPLELWLLGSLRDIYKA